MVHGEKDVLVAPPPPETVQDLEENVRQIILRDSLHFPMLDAATKFHRLVRDFLDSDPASLVLKDEWKRRSR
jgi:pimeloyl-ACP methyl ester carboxylesterase